MTLRSIRAEWFGVRFWCVWAACWMALAVRGAGPGAGAGAGESTLYALIQGSTFTAGGRAPLVPLRGAFRLTPQISPLDRQFYRVEGVRLEIGGDAGARTVLRGGGYYSLGGRGAQTQQLVLDLTDGEASRHFDSGLVPADGAFPELDLSLFGDAPLRPAIHCRAVPELSRQRYSTVLGTSILDDCSICDRLARYVPLAGSFDLVHTGGNPLFERYHVFNLQLRDSADPVGLEVTGEGTLEVGGEVALQQKWTLELTIRTPTESRTITLRNEDSRVGRLWPMLRVDLAEDGGTVLSRYFLTLAAAPFRELWFGIPHGLTPGAAGVSTKHLGPADILSDSGRVVVPGDSWLSPTGLPADVGLDAFDVVPGGAGVISVSPDREAISSQLGRVGEGDLLGSDGTVRVRNGALVSAFGFMPVVPDLGLDAVFQRSAKEWLFSTRRAAFSERLGVTIGRGDLLSSQGTVVRRQAELLAHFQPPAGKPDYGLDAFHVWPSGEIWFSLESGFQDAALGPISDGDILSDQGYVVGRNLDLLRPFQPLEDVANFGLQGLWVVSDVAVAGPALARWTTTPTGPALRWSGLGRVFQVESTERLDDPFVAAGPLTPAVDWPLPPAPALRQGFFRVRSW